jgi:hypothetical protein
MLSRNQERLCMAMGMNPHEFIEMNSENMAEITAQAAQEQRDEQARVQDAEQAVRKLMNITPAEWKQMQLANAACQLTLEETEVCQKMGILPVDYLEQKMKDAGIKQSLDGRIKIK